MKHNNYTPVNHYDIGDGARHGGWSADVSGEIRYWDYLAQQCIYTIDEHRPSRQTLGIAVNCTADKIVSFGADSVLYIYDVKTRARVTHLTHTYVRRAAPHRVRHCLSSMPFVSLLAGYMQDGRSGSP